MPSFGPEVISPTASVTDDALENLAGAIPGMLKDILTGAPPGYVRVITRLFQGNYTNITRLRIVRGREELARYAVAHAAAYDNEKAVAVSFGFMQGVPLSFKATTGAAPAITIAFNYEDRPI